MTVPHSSKAMHTGLIFDIKKFSVHDGPGIRTTVFFKGCPLSCRWCHNPESRDAHPRLFYDSDKCVGCHDCVGACPEGAISATPDGSLTDAARCTGQGACAAACPSEARQLVGRRYGVADLMAEIEKDRVFFDESGGGVTFSGGEPLMQWRFLLDVLRACGKRGIHRTVDTTGVGPSSALLRIAAETDLFLYDIKTMNPQLHMEMTGVRLLPILDNLQRLLASGARVKVRVPMIPGVSDGINIERTAEFLRDLPGIEGVHLLPYHAAAREKHRRFGIPWLMPDDLATPPGQVQTMAERMRSYGLAVTVGG
jgi:pyruvate formate lyase activating enzyme